MADVAKHGTFLSPGEQVILRVLEVQNRLLVLPRWTFSYLTRGRGARLIHD